MSYYFVFLIRGFWYSFILNLICLFLEMLPLRCCLGSSLAVGSAVCGLLIAVASLVAEHRLQRARALIAEAPGLLGSIAVVPGLSRFMVYEIFLDQGLNPCLLQW